MRLREKHLNVFGAGLNSDDSGRSLRRGVLGSAKEERERERERERETMRGEKREKEDKKREKYGKKKEIIIF
jgi:hypothetical protein